MIACSTVLPVPQAVREAKAIAMILFDKGLVSDEQMARVVDETDVERVVTSLTQILIENGIVTGNEINRIFPNFLM